MNNESFVYKGQVYRTGDNVKANYDGKDVGAAKIYVCTKDEQGIVSTSSYFSVIIFICNNNFDNPISSFTPIGKLGFTMSFPSGFRSDSNGSWSDHLTKIEKCGDELKNIIEIMALTDMAAIKKGK